jgi:hypothetical protein
VPVLAGYVLTVPREGLAQVAISNKTEEGVDPIFAYWNHGLGRSIAFTSDAGTRWLGEVDHLERVPGILGAVRAVACCVPPVPSNAQVRTRVEGDTAIVDLEATERKPEDSRTT